MHPTHACACYNASPLTHLHACVMLAQASVNRHNSPLNATVPELLMSDARSDTGIRLEGGETESRREGEERETERDRDKERG